MNFQFDPLYCTIAVLIVLILLLFVYLLLTPEPDEGTSDEGFEKEVRR